MFASFILFACEAMDPTRNNPNDPLGSEYLNSDISVMRGIKEVGQSSTVDFGSKVIITGQNDITFSIYNTGQAPLSLTGNPIISIEGANASEFSVVTAPAITIGPNSSSNFTIRFEPDTAGIKNATVYIKCDDLDEHEYSFNIQGMGTTDPVPEIHISQVVSGDILDGTGSYNFGNIQVNSPSSDIEFTIANLGDSSISLTGTPYTVQISGKDASMFTRVSDASGPIEASGVRYFTLRFTPTSMGEKTATISIPNNDDDENPYDFTIKGTGIEAEMDVKQDTKSIADGGSFDFGGARINVGLELEFTVENNGNATLNFTGYEFTGTDAALFTVTEVQSSSVSPGGSMKFKIRFLPTDIGPKTAVLSIANNDLNENPYNFTITGTGNDPEINIMQGTTDIAVGGIYTYIPATIGSPVNVDFTIYNTSSYGSLEITNSGLKVIIDGSNASDFTAGTLPVTIAPLGSYITTIGFNPIIRGTRRAVAHVYSDDRSEPDYWFNLIGEAKITPKIYYIDGALKRMNLDGSNSESTGATISGNQCIQYDWISNKVYYTTARGSSGYIKKCDLDGSNDTTIVSANTNNIAVDATNSRIYYSTIIYYPDTYRLLMRVNFDGTGGLQIAKHYGVYEISGIAFSTDKLYYILHHSVIRCNLDGSQSQTITPSGCTGMSDIAVNGTYVYYGGQEGGGPYRILCKSDLDGSNYTTLVTGGIYEGVNDIALDVAKGHIYYWSNDNIMRANMSDGTGITTIKSSITPGSDFCLDLDYRND